MKKAIKSLALSLFFLFSGSLLSQAPLTGTFYPITPEGVFDVVYDKDGTPYSLASLEIKEDEYNGNLFVASATACQAGFFKVYFANGSGMESISNATHTARRNTVCEVLRNLSELLKWPSGGPSFTVNILVDNIANHVANPSTNSTLGAAGAFYAFPNAPTSAYPGVAESMIEKTIKSQYNAWQNITSPMYISGFNFYHGMMFYNFSNSSFNWFDDYANGTAGANQYDLYSVVLHEVMHMLGFASLIGPTGISKFGASNNYYSSYDQFLVDRYGNPLLTSGGCSPSYSLNFTGSSTLIAPGNCTSSSVSDITTCSLACKYNSGTVANQTVYTSTCFEAGSSLSHFEDMCPNSANNNQIFVMSNALSNGLNKRYLKEEERYVLCDIGYSVATTYTSNAVSASYTYTGSNCNRPYIWGRNDGIVNNAYTYTSAGGPFTIAISGSTNSILNNDATTATTAICVENVYSNGTVSVAGNIITFSPSPNYFGFVLLRYIPVDNSSNNGNITYIYAYVYPAACSPVSPCDMVQNGGFENRSGCGPVNGGTAAVNCWAPYNLNVDLFYSGCTNCISGICADLGNSTYNSNPTFSSHISLNTNNSVIGIGGYCTPSTYTNGADEAMQTYLGTPLINGQVYKLSFWAYEYSGNKQDAAVPAYTLRPANTNSVPLVLCFATSGIPVPAPAGVIHFPPAGLNVFLTPTLQPVFNTWRNYNYTFTYTASSPTAQSIMYVGLHTLNNYISHTIATSPTISAQLEYYALIDDISILPINDALTFTLPSGTICTAMSFTDLAQYCNHPGGVFTGSYITTSTNSLGTTYTFNQNGNAPNGVYTITYSYTNALNCQQLAVQHVTINNVTYTASLSHTYGSGCTSNQGTLSVISPTSTNSYTWMPGSLSGSVITVTTSSATTYSVNNVSQFGCPISGTIHVVPNIPNLSLTHIVDCSAPTHSLIANGTFTSIVWSPGSQTTSAVNFSPPVNTTYTATATSSSGCTSTQTITLASLGLTLSANQPTLCYGSSSTLSAVGNFTQMLWNGGGSNTFSTVVTPTSTTIFSATGTNSLDCQVSQTVLVTVIGTFDIIPTLPTFCKGDSQTLTATGTFTSVSWQPGGATTSFIVVTPTVSTTYSATASFTNGCVTTYTYGIVSNTACCSNTIPVIPSPTISTLTFTGTNTFLNDVTIPNGSTLTLKGEFLMAPNVKIIVANGAQLMIYDSHLYGCQNSMWQGIVLQNGGKIKFDKDNQDNLIEDAITAIDVSSYTAAVNPILDISRTTFNKNYISINISNYPISTASYSSAFQFNSCVFTSRSLPFNSTQWPQTGSTSNLNTVGADLRYVNPSTPTTGLVPPYLGQTGFTITNLKNPYSYQTSHIAIKLSNVGSTNGNTFYSILLGDPSTSGAFSLFDAHDVFVYAINSNLILKNHAFQNQKNQQMPIQGVGSKALSSAVLTNVTNQMNTQLDLTANSFHLGNRFWNCYRSITGYNTYKFNIEKAIFRSTQSTSASFPHLQVGNTGISLRTNRFMYYMSGNEFTNIGNCINIPVVAGSYTTQGSGGATLNGVYAANIAILQNTFAPGSGGSNFVNKAVNISCPIQFPLSSAPSSVTPYAVGIVVESNLIDDAYRGIYINGVTGFTTETKTNDITLKNDNLYNLSQHGIDYSNNISALNIQKHFVIRSNSVSAQSTTYSPVSLVFCDNNLGFKSPSVTCNNLDAAYRGFVFSGPNNNAVWAGNVMKPLSRGLTLENSGIIGIQGSNGTANNNQWTGTWTSTLNFGTYVAVNSAAQNSLLWVKNTGNLYPTNPGGSTLTPQNWYGQLNTLSVSTGGDYSCGSDPNNFIINIPQETDFEDSRLYYISTTALYRFLHLNDSLKESDGDLVDFYSDLYNSNIDKYMRLEEYLFEGNLSAASSLYSSITADDDNEVDVNYNTFYSLYINYLTSIQDEEEFNSTDSTSLIVLASLCPAIQGACIYQARALYNVIYGVVLDFSDCSESSESKYFYNNNPISGSKQDNWKIKIFPNPTSNQITITSNKENESLKVIITDLSRRILQQNYINVNKFQSTLSLDLINGAYLITLINSENETITKKLLIAK
jgi:hypothetical protein